MKSKLFVFFLSILPISISAQNLTTAFAFLELPISTHSSGLGGNTISLTNSEPSLIIANPSLLSNIKSKTVGLNYMNWLSSTNVAGIQYCNPIDDKSAFGLSIRYVTYGTMKETTAENIETGTFSSKDMSFSGTYYHKLNSKWDGGITGHVIYSHYSSLSSVAIGVDLGLCYKEDDFSFGIAATNIGGQIKAFDDVFEDLPLNFTASGTWKLSHAPVKLTVALTQLHKWSSHSFATAQDTDPSFSTVFFRHLSFGADVLLTEQLYVSVGCNLKNRAELSNEGHKGLEGFSIGSGLQLKKVQFGLSFGKYQVSTSSLMFNFAYNL